MKEGGTPESREQSVQIHEKVGAVQKYIHACLKVTTDDKQVHADVVLLLKLTNAGVDVIQLAVPTTLDGNLQVQRANDRR
jgi:hypothetical protein